ncbi:polysaccharide deacetylase family protein [Amycolatopsis rhabdoformis]|uniref:Polysaccharide deacetylase family protein n=1 Tax=Amycolatopsis rhabdoformis TaxID=1448059 RepID=A0ABZ1I7V9_9PSEU|nr:polysaccharide deacetylase family protein [Amycolatopsis rhabdoformis]WSE30447.1 polysaccharide deacetylase family protein [Amycolatopsis rhabdoformis]
MGPLEREPYRHWPIDGRPELRYPGGKVLACYVALNIERFDLGRPATSRTGVTAGLPVDPLNHGWRDYGARVGFWRLLEALDRFELPVSTLLNADAALAYPEIVAAGRERGWAFLGHGRSNSELWTGFDRDTERAALREIVRVLTETTGARPRGWLGPALTETANTLGLLAELGFTYSLDWIVDDQPVPLDAGGTPFLSVPYSIEINDIPAFVDQGLTPAQFTELVVDQFEVLHAEAARRPGAVFSVSLHPFLVGQPFRHKHLLTALEAISGHHDVWYANTDEIARWFLADRYEQATQAIDEHHRRTT